MDFEDAHNVKDPLPHDISVIHSATLPLQKDLSSWVSRFSVLNIHVYYTINHLPDFTLGYILQETFNIKMLA